MFLAVTIAVAEVGATNLRFTDVTDAAGIQHSQYASLGPGLPDAHAMSGGAAAADIDGDGWVDVFCARMDGPDVVLFNRGDGTFETRTATDFGLGQSQGSNGAAWADIDNDGDLDLYLTTIGRTRHALFVNDGRGSFHEEAVLRGVALQDAETPTTGFSATFGDYDGDGWLDLYTTAWRDPEGRRNRLFRNRGPAAPGFFTDVTRVAGVELVGDPSTYAWGFDGQFVDIDHDGHLDLLVAADYGTSRLFWNVGDGTFRDGTRAAGVGTDENGMGSAVGDVDGDGYYEWFVSSIHDEMPFAANWGVTGNRLYRYRGGRRFADATDQAGVRAGGWGWGCAFADLDRDGDLDLVLTNGVEFPNTKDALRFRRDPSRLWENLGDGRFREVAARAGFADSASGKALLVFDYDGDADLDLFVVHTGERPRLYRNDTVAPGSWLEVVLAGKVSNRNGLGARISLRAGERLHVLPLQGPSGFLGQSALPLSLGVGAAASVAWLRVEWPSGRVDTWKHLNANRRWVLAEGESEVPHPPDGMLSVQPNPFRRRAVVTFAVPVASAVRLDVYDVRGRRVRSLVHGFLRPGVHLVEWQGDTSGGASAPSTVYFCRLESSAGTSIRRLHRLR